MAHAGGVVASAAAGDGLRCSAGDLLLVQMLGFALAVAVLLDATLIRMAVGPALLCLAGRWKQVARAPRTLRAASTWPQRCSDPDGDRARQPNWLIK